VSTLFRLSNLPLHARLVLAALALSPAAQAQKASITEKVQSMKTYPFSDPSPLPVMGIGKKVAPFYPYYVFDGYTSKGTPKNWKIVELENPYIKVQVLPEVGGKVMGATEKSTGEEFVYTNHVMKFRAIGIRGPWTSGGIEHNFGLDLGHAPWAAAPVDYVLQNNADGSVTCVVGGLDLASRTQWRVKIVLPKDKAYFETQSLWYNPLPLHDAYLSWENAAFKASDDMQFFFPGTHHVGHDGNANPWPLDENGVDLSYYKNNNSGGDKSYHVVGTHTEWFGGYWHDRKFGFGHWAPYSDAPGKKLWIWSRAREGGIWEDLLTDKDGQYIEAQSGVTFNQASEQSGFHSPFNQKSLGPFYSETKTEYWFPVKGVGGMADASPYGTLNVTTGGDSLKIFVNPISPIQDTLKVTAAGKTIYQAPLQLKPMEVYVKTISLSGIDQKSVRVSIGKDRLVYATQPEKVLDRPLLSENKQDPHSAERLFELGEDENAMRNFEGARKRYLDVLEKQATHSGALIRLAEYHYRKGEYAQGLDFARKVLAENTYHGGANYLYGALYRKLGDLTKAQEALSVATWTMEYRSGAYAQLAGIALQKQDFEKAEHDARKALEYNRNNLVAYQALGTALRKLNKPEQAAQVRKELLEIDPLSHYAHFEQYLNKHTDENRAIFQSAIRSELPHETYLELAMDYVNQGQNQEAKQVLALAPAYPTVSYWLAYLNRDSSPAESQKHLQKAIAMSPELVFPFRLESIPVLIWAEKQNPSWKNRYYLGLIYWHIRDKENAKKQFASCQNEPDYAPFYMARGILLQSDAASNAQAQFDFLKAKQLNPKEWRTWHYLTNYANNNRLQDEGFENAKTAYNKFPNNPVIGIDYAKSLLSAGDFNGSLKVLDQVHVLPQEGAREGHSLYVTANLAQALALAENQKYKDALKSLEKARLWPEHLGTGKPHEPDTRLIDYLAAHCEAQLGHQEKAQQYEKNITAYTLHASKESNRHALSNYLGMKILHEAGNQEAATKFLATWKAEQDSLSKWDIKAGTNAPEAQWILAKTQQDETRIEKLRQDLTGDKQYNQTTLFFQILDLASTRRKKD
jgi:tetratricopeptide (TPR) repeat protein